MVLEWDWNYQVMMKMKSPTIKNQALKARKRLSPRNPKNWKLTPPLFA